MGIIKKFAAIQLVTQTIDNEVCIALKFGRIEGPYYDLNHPPEEFDTEEEAIIWAEKENEWARWLIVPIIKFEI